RTGRRTRRGRALLTPTPNPRKKRTPCRRYLVSLEIRRRTPTRLSRSRRREIRHEQESDGVSSRCSPPRSFDTLRRSVAPRESECTDSATLTAGTGAVAGGIVGDRGEAGTER